MIYFVRHGSTDWNENVNAQGVKEPKCQGRANLDINAKGILQAEQTAQQLKNVKFDRVICSPLKRARQTLEIIYHGDIPIQIDERVIERDFGEFEGLNRAEFDFNGFWNINSNQKFERAESIKDVEVRVISLLNELKENPNKNILIVSHGGVGCVLMSCFKGVPEDGNYLSFEIPNGKPLILDFNEMISQKLF